MAAYNLEEQEHIDELKAWWARRGSLVTSIALVIALGGAGWALWGQYQNKQAREASVVYGSLLLAADKLDKPAVQQLAGKLISDYPATSQAKLGALLAASVAANAEDFKTAKLKLNFVVEKSDDALVRDVARLRLGALLLDEKAYDEALKLLQATPNDAFAARFDDLRGDIHLAKGNPAEARQAYRKALERLEADKDTTPEAKSLVVLKLEALGEGA